MAAGFLFPDLNRWTVDFTQLIVLIASFRDAVAQKKIWTAISIAGQITAMIAQIVAKNTSKTVQGVIGFDELERELAKLKHPEHRTMVTAASADEHNLTGFAIEAATLAAILQVVISLIESLLKRANAPQPARATRKANAETPATSAEPAKTDESAEG